MRAPVCAIFCCASLIGTCTASALAWRATEHAGYHRSKAAENEMLWRLLLAFPLGTDLDDFTRRLGLSPGDRVARGELIEIRLRPTLSIGMGEARSYPGFSFFFRNGVLVDAGPVGPDAPGKDIDVSSALEMRAAPTPLQGGSH